MDFILTVFALISFVLLGLEFDGDEFKRFMRVVVLYWIALLFGVMLGEYFNLF